MTEDEAISELEKFQIQVEHSIAEEECCKYDNSERELQKDKKFLYAFDIAITALKEVQQYQKIGTVEDIKKAISVISLPDDSLITKDFHELYEYRKIGTVEECGEAAGKQKPKKPRILMSRGGKGGKYCICPRCEAVTGKHIPFCRLCGQAIDWSNEDEQD